MARVLKEGGEGGTRSPRPFQKWRTPQIKRKETVDTEERLRNKGLRREGPT